MKKTLSAIGYFLFTPICIHLAFVALGLLIFVSRSGGLSGAILQLLFVDYWEPLSLCGVTVIHLLIGVLSAFGISNGLSNLFQVSEKTVKFTLFIYAAFLILDIIIDFFYTYGPSETIEIHQFYGTLKICFLFGVVYRMVSDKLIDN